MGRIKGRQLPGVFGLSFHPARARTQLGSLQSLFGVEKVGLKGADGCIPTLGISDVLISIY
jgi:hypothetical protein